jgi:hypothetical protein
VTEVEVVDVALLGLPAAGKTTYLAALYSSLDEALPGAPSLRRQPTTRAYLEKIRDAWLDGNPVDRTAIGTGELIELDVDMSDGSEISLRIPDVSGESFTGVLASRTLDAALAQVVRDSSGVLLFTHPGHVQRRVPIVQAVEQGFIDKDDPAMVLRDFDPAQAPTETQLVDLLQWAARLKEETLPLRAALVLSAWDEMGKVTPQQWLAQLPLLRQYLDNSGAIDVRVFGVSAQGGKYGGKHDPVTKPPMDRPFVVTEDGTRHNDITLPLRWAAGR